MTENLISLREKVGRILCEFGNDERIFVLDTDLAKSTTTAEFRSQYPNRFLEMGISEQSAMSVASGLVIEGEIPFYVSFALFTTGTAWTQLRQACYSNLNVKVIGTHPGLDDGPDGASHHANEDLALTRALPGITILTPASVEDLRDSIALAINTDGPFYIRVARDAVPVLDIPHTPVKIGKTIVNYDDGNDLAIFYEGTAMKAAFEGYCTLKCEGFQCKLINISCLKPIDTDTLCSVAETVKGVVTVENHSVMAGLGGAVAEVLMNADISVKFAQVGIQDVFTESGAIADLKRKYGIYGENVAECAKALLK
ncbi:transketolase C-terminal domain-containing protein [Clostridium sp. KNHs216]|uniref:transketolase family protein n=1 Tax=Clostridium sp. KNHs216 TaxID=1550235 RepID=UPI00114DE69D|nr:transketolase C-terminal domain-containing protein [Clostridium sp. KNHs216]TQI68303.1 transketolase [Clostridium sp. KNHs216]